MARRSRPRRVLGLAIVIALLALALGLATGVRGALAGSSPAPSSGPGTLRLGWTTEPDNLNPFIGYLAADYEIYYLNYDMLINYDPATLKARPDLAVSWSHSPDGLVWTFKLRHGVKWQDGVPFTARDVAFTYNYIVDNQLSAFDGYTDGITKAVAVGDDTVVMHCSHPKANMIGLPIPIVPQHIWSHVSPKAAATSFDNDPPVIGTGPFQVVEWKKGSYIRLRANPDYWKGRPHIDQILFENYTNAYSMTADAKSGALDGAWGFPPALYKSLAADTSQKVCAYPAIGFDELTFNCSKGPFGNPVLRDPAFRQALNWAIDKNTINRLAYGGYVRPATSVVPDKTYQADLDWHWQPSAAQAYTFDLAKAGAALDAAGYKLGPNGARLDKQGKPISLTLYVRAESLSSQVAGKLLTSWFRKIGLNVKLSVVSEGALSNLIWNTVKGKPAPNYDMFVWGWVGDVDPNFTMSILTSSQIGGWNQANWSDPAYDRLYTKQTSELDPQQRKATIWQMEQIIYQQSPFIPLIYNQNLESYNVKKWQGWVLSPAKIGGAWYTFEMDSYLNLRPRTEATSSGGSSKTGWIVGLIVIVVIAAGTIGWSRRRGHGTAATEE